MQMSQRPKLKPIRAQPTQEPSGLVYRNPRMVDLNLRILDALSQAI
jgi:hypothetical protein